jgi:hypothetical protein
VENPLLLLLFIIGAALVLRALEKSREKTVRRVVREELASLFRTDDGEDYGVGVHSVDVRNLSICRKPQAHWRNREVEGSAP